MPKRFFKLADDVNVSHRWDLAMPRDNQGLKVDDGQFRYSAAEQTGEEADVLLCGPGRSASSEVIVPVRRRRVSGSEEAVPRVVVVPTRQALLSGADGPWVEAVAVRVPARAEPRG